MQNKRLILLSTVLVTVMLSISCMLFVPSGALKLEPDRLPDAQLGVPYEAEIQVTQNRTPVGDFSISDGTLPAGLELKKVEGVEDTTRIKGVATESGTFTFKISVWCYGTNVSGRTGEKEYRIAVK